jgi:hypothetical protein
MAQGLSRKIPDPAKRIRTLGSSVIPTTPAGGYPTTQENFPSLIEAFTEDGINGNNLVGALGTVTITNSTGWTQPAATQFRATASGSFTTSGAWSAIGARHALMILVGKFNIASTNVKFGDAANGVGVALIDTGAWAFNSSNLALILADHGGISYPIDGRAFLLNQTSANGTAGKYSIDGATNLGPTAATILGDVSQNWPAFTIGAAEAQVFSESNSYLTGAYLHAFSNVPSDATIFEATRWMFQNPKKIYPGFYKLT